MLPASDRATVEPWILWLWLSFCWNRLLHDVTDRLAVLAVAGLAGGILLLPAALIHPPSAVPRLVILSALAETAYALCLTAAYRRGSLSLVYPLGRGTAPLLVVAGTWLIFQQPFRLSVALGAALLGAGLVLVATRGKADYRTGAVGFALLTGMSIATYSVIDAHAVHHASPAGYISLVLFLQGTLLSLLVRGDLTRWQAALRPGLLIGVGSLAAYLLVLFAFQRASPGRVSTLRETSILIGVLLARERPGRTVWLGAGMVVAGAILVAV